jgi:hypothetical protein
MEKKDKIDVQQTRDALVNGQTSRHLEPTHVSERIEEQKYVEERVMQGIKILNNGTTQLQLVMQTTNNKNISHNS